MKSTVVEPAPAKSVKPAKPAAVEPTTAMKSTKPAAVEPTASTPAVRPGIGEIWLAECGRAKQSGCGCQSPSYPWPGSMFA